MDFFLLERDEESTEGKRFSTLLYIHRTAGASCFVGVGLLAWSVLSEFPSDRLLQYGETLKVHFEEGRLVSSLGCEGSSEVARFIVQMLGDLVLHTVVPGGYLHDICNFYP